jgi:general nucleoside transport system permease protein
MNHTSMRIAIPFLAVICAFILSAALIAVIGADPIQAFQCLGQGAFGSLANFGETFVKASPLIFTGLAATFAYRCGVFNLGAEGQFIMGSVASIWIVRVLGTDSGVPGILASLMCGAIAGGIWGAIPGFLKIARGLNEMIVSIMLNYVALLFMGFIYTGPLRDGSVPQTFAVGASIKLPRLIEETRANSGILIALIVAAIVYYFLFHTSKGFKLRAVGLNKTAASFNGYRVKAFMLAAFIVSGAIAGLGGSVELHGTQYRLMAGYGSGYGFDGVAIALIGQLNPIGTVIVAYLFAALRTGATMMQVGSGVPTSVINIIQALVIIFSVAASAAVNLPAVKNFVSRRKMACN